MIDYLTITMLKPIYPPGNRCGDCLHMACTAIKGGFVCLLENRSGFKAERVNPQADANTCREFLVD